MIVTDYPKCFDSPKDYASWRAHARVCHTTMTEHAHCEDCSFEHQSAMIRARRCSNPGFIFAQEEVEA